MNDRIFRSVQNPIRGELSWEETWTAKDQGLIKSWEVGRELRISNPELAQRAEKGELPVLAWKGGVAKPIKAEKFGSLFYLAQWQGLRGEDLDIALNEERRFVCSKTGVSATYTADLAKYGGGNQSEAEEGDG